MSGRGRQPGQRHGSARNVAVDSGAGAEVWKAEPFSSFDAFPVLSQAKSAYQWICGDELGARVTWERCKVYGPVISQICSAADYFSGFATEAAERQRAFIENLSRTWIAAAEALPVTAPFIASAHYCSGDRKRSEWIAKKASRSCLVLVAGASVCAAAGPAMASNSHLILAGGAGALTGLAADALLVARPSVPRPLTPGENFDWAAMRVLDAIRAIAGFDLVLVFWPEHASQISMWVEPISVGDAARLVMGKATSAEDAALAGALDHIPSGVDHVFVLWKTNKGHLFVSERLHDGRVLVEDLHRGTVVPFAHGKQMPMEDLHRMGAGGSVEPGHGAGPSAASVSNMDTLAAIKAPEAAAKAISGGKAQLFSQHALKDGPTVASFQELAKAKSMAGYDLLQANCQHYAQDFWNFAVGHRLGMPNQEFLNLFKIFGAPSHGGRMIEPGVLGNASYAIRAVHPCRIIADLALLKLPVVPARGPTEESEEVEARREVPPSRGGEVATTPPPERERTWV